MFEGYAFENKTKLRTMHFKPHPDSTHNSVYLALHDLRNTSNHNMQLVLYFDLTERAVDFRQPTYPKTRTKLTS